MRVLALISILFFLSIQTVSFVWLIFYQLFKYQTSETRMGELSIWHYGSWLWACINTVVIGVVSLQSFTDTLCSRPGVKLFGVAMIIISIIINAVTAYESHIECKVQSCKNFRKLFSGDFARG